MPISRDLSDLPTDVASFWRMNLGPLGQAESPAGFDPIEPIVGAQLLDRWFQRYQDEGHLHRAMAVEGARFRHSWAGMCARAIQYLMTDTEQSNPPDVASFWRMNLGTLVHDGMQTDIEAITHAAEVPVTIQRERYHTAGHVDLIVTVTDENGDMTVIADEMKTMNGFSFKLAATWFKGAPQGPRHSAILQASLNAVGYGADEARVTYLSMENVSPQLLRLAFDSTYAPFLAEWRIENFAELAEKELLRIDAIVDFIDNDRLAPRAIPDPQYPTGSRVISVGDGQKKGTWRLERDGQVVGVGDVWQCSYCDFRDQCHDDGP